MPGVVESSGEARRHRNCFVGGSVALAPFFGEDKRHIEQRQFTPEPQLTKTIMMGTASAQSIPMFGEALDFAVAPVAPKYRITFR